MASVFDYSMMTINSTILNKEYIGRPLVGFIRVYQYFTIWGMFFTLMHNIANVLIKPGQICEKLTKAEKYDIWQAWKWKIFLFEMATFMEFIIVPYFWQALYQKWVDAHPNAPFFLYLSLIMDHSLPFLTLLVEYIFVSSTPFIHRHFFLCAGLSIFYLFCNMLICKISGHFVYPTFTWDSWGQFIGLPVGFTLGGVVIFFGLTYLTKLKLKFLKHDDIHEVIFNNSRVKKVDTMKL